MRIELTSDEREKILVEHLPMVTWIVRKYADLAKLQSGVDSADLYQEGVLALVESIEKFESDKGVKFRTFAHHRVRGAMIDYMRRYQHSDRYTLGMRRKMFEIQDRYMQEQYRMPTDEELRKEMGCTLRLIKNLQRIILRVHSGALMPSDEVMENLGTSLLQSEEPSVFEQVFDDEVRTRVAEAMSQLPDMEQKIITMVYFERIPIHRIVEELKVSHAWVWQLHRRAKEFLRNQLGELRSTTPP